MNHEIDRTHVDAELERARRHEGAEPPDLERVLELGAPVFGDRAVVREGERLASELFLAPDAVADATPPAVTPLDATPLEGGP